jgi:hypothetical protein
LELSFLPQVAIRGAIGLSKYQDSRFTSFAITIVPVSILPFSLTGGHIVRNYVQYLQDGLSGKRSNRKSRRLVENDIANRN